jgi:hypothetical protein
VLLPPPPLAPPLPISDKGRLRWKTAATKIRGGGRSTQAVLKAGRQAGRQAKIFNISLTLRLVGEDLDSDKGH